MSKVKRKAKVKVLPFGAARYLNDGAAIAEYVVLFLKPVMTIAVKLR